MSEKDDKSRKPGSAESGSSSDKSENGQSDHLGQALRSIYHETVKEEIPPEMLELLGKLE